MLQLLFMSIDKQTQIPAEYITRRELCERLKIHPGTSYRLDRQGIIQGVRVGGSIRYEWNSVVNNIESTKGGSHEKK